MKAYRKLLFAILPFLFMLTLAPVHSQDKKGEIDASKTQDEIQKVYVEAYSIMDLYPELDYTFVYEDGNVTDVNIIGIPDLEQKQNLASYLIRIEDLKSEIMNMQDEAGIYFVTETEPQPKDGYKDFYRDLHINLEYPETAEEHGVEGTIFVKFVVESDGEVTVAETTNNIDTPFDIAEKDLTKEAKRAVKATSGDWIPAKVGEIPVNQWVYLPVKFDLESPLYMGFNK